jgi:hypothetical protein
MEGLGGTSPWIDEVRRPRESTDFSRRVASGRFGRRHASGGAGHPRRLTHRLTDSGASNLHRPDRRDWWKTFTAATEGAAFEGTDRELSVCEPPGLATNFFVLGRARRSCPRAGCLAASRMARLPRCAAQRRDERRDPACRGTSSRLLSWASRVGEPPWEPDTRMLDFELMSTAYQRRLKESCRTRQRQPTDHHAKRSPRVSCSTAPQ